MANTEALVRLMRHAAQRLREEDIRAIANASNRIDRIELATSTMIAVAYAEAILSTVAEIMTDAEATVDAERP